MFNFVNVFEVVDQEKEENLRKQMMCRRLPNIIERGRQLAALQREARHIEWVRKTTTPRLAITVFGYQVGDC
jgi:hypothetical protein